MATSPTPPSRTHPGLREEDFRKVSENGFGDGFNAYAYSMAWFNDHIFVGTSRANLQLLKMAMPFVRMDMWPVETPFKNYSPEFEASAARGEIWRYHPPTDTWKRVYQSPLVTDAEGTEFSRDLGYRAMMVYQGKSDTKPALYVASWSRSKGNGPDFLRTEDGETFDVLPKARFHTGETDITFNAIRALTVFKGKLYTAPTGATGGNINASGVTYVYATDDPVSGEWQCVNDPGFGKIPEVVTVYDLAPMGDHLYAGTGGLNGFEIWRTDGESESLPYHWERVIHGGAGRGALNQGAVAMKAFKGALYIGSGIQNGGFDWKYKVGPAAAEIIRLNADLTWDIVVGNARDGKEPVSGLHAGFDNFFAGYLWRMGEHDGWLYAGTMDWLTILQFSKLDEKPMRIARALGDAGIEDLLELKGGFELWRTCDGENWLPVTVNGFHNPYNYGCRNIISTPHGLFIGSANPFGPRIARRVGKDWEWTYEDNPRGGLEIWKSKPPAGA